MVRKQRTVEKFSRKTNTELPDDIWQYIATVTSPAMALKWSGVSKLFCSKMDSRISKGLGDCVSCSPAHAAARLASLHSPAARR